jgi:hypothetical protein
MKKKILVSGNPSYGLAASLNHRFPEAEFASRSSGYDLTTDTDRHRFAERSLNFDVYISCSSLHSFAQTLLLKEVVTLWEEKKHGGYIIVLGSSADTPIKGTVWLYPIEKKGLRSYCRNLSQRVLGGKGSSSNNIRMTYLSCGNLNTPQAEQKYPDENKIDCAKIAEIIDWLLTQPEDINFSELCLDAIQSPAPKD